MNSNVYSDRIRKAFFLYFGIQNDVGRHFVAQLSAGLLCQRQRQGLSPFHLQGSCRFSVKACTVFRIRLRQIDSRG